MSNHRKLEFHLATPAGAGGCLFTEKVNVSGSNMYSDTGQIANCLFLPYWFWAILLTGFTLFLPFWSFYQAMGRK